MTETYGNDRYEWTDVFPKVYGKSVEIMAAEQDEEDASNLNIRRRYLADQAVKYANYVASASDAERLALVPDRVPGVGRDKRAWKVYATTMNPDINPAFTTTKTPPANASAEVMEAHEATPQLNNQLERRPRLFEKELETRSTVTVRDFNRKLDDSLFLKEELRLLKAERDLLRAQVAPSGSGPLLARNDAVARELEVARAEVRRLQGQPAVSRTSKDVWENQCFLQEWAFRARSLQMREKKDVIDALVKKFDDQLQEQVAVRGLPIEKAYQDFSLDREPLLRLDDHVAQAFSGRTLEPRDRCVRCRKTFGYSWTWPERKESELGPKDWADFEKGSGSSEGLAGKCAEYLVWVQCTHKGGIDASPPPPDHPPSPNLEFAIRTVCIYDPLYEYPYLKPTPPAPCTPAPSHAMEPRVQHSAQKLAAALGRTKKPGLFAVGKFANVNLGRAIIGELDRQNRRLERIWSGGGGNFEGNTVKAWT
ncbi:MAG: hypothetical protein M1826_000612 [Phylliscum demangeonii]|nr:MAG: hypothetical protein M1826_000612 [Phylliscum demangeonii]